MKTHAHGPALSPSQFGPRLLDRRDFLRTAGGLAGSVALLRLLAGDNLLAASALDERPSAGGRAYFISQGTPVPLWGWIARVLELHGVAPVRRKISARVARMLATVAETAWRTGGFKSDPPLTRFLAEEMATDHYFDISAARRELGYAPSLSVWEATERSFGGTSVVRAGEGRR